MPNRLHRTLGLLKAALAFSLARGWDRRAARIRAARHDLRPPEKLPPTPGPLPYPAIAAARRQSHAGPAFEVGTCLQQVRTCYGIGPREHDAGAAWHAAETRHGPGVPAPRGFPVFWLGGSHGYGHIAISTGDGHCWSTDIRRPGFFDYVPLTEIHTRWGLEYVGWTEDLNGVRIEHGKAAV